MKHENLEKEETKRYYKFDFDSLTEALKLEGEWVTFDILDKDGGATSTLKIITRVTEEKDDPK